MSCDLPSPKCVTEASSQGCFLLLQIRCCWFLFCCGKCFVCQFSKIKILKRSMEHSRRALESGEGLIQVWFVLASGLCLNDHIREAALGFQLNYL